MSYKNEKFAQVDGNQMCFKIPWDYFGKQDLFLKWEEGKTGFPWIDACMRQLVQEGWIHHICRNSVAIFLTRGDLFLSWERGMKTFFKYLIDVNYRFKHIPTELNYSKFI
jgi:cryptochrome